MCCFEEAIGNCMPAMPAGVPMDWLDPYGDTPLAGGMEARVDIEVVESDGTTRVTSVKTPPKSGRIRLSEVIESIMGPQNGSPCAADQAKCSETDIQENVPQNEESDTDDRESGKMESSGPPSSREQGSQPWGGGKSEAQKGTPPAKGDRKDPRPKG